MTGRDFTSGTQFAYSDKWQNDLDIYLQWLYETFLMLHLLLSEHGSLYVHLDWRATHYPKLILDEVSGFSPMLKGPGSKAKSSGTIRQGDALKSPTLENTIQSPLHKIC